MYAGGPLGQTLCWGAGGIGEGPGQPFERMAAMTPVGVAMLCRCAGWSRERVVSSGGPRRPLARRGLKGILKSIMKYVTTKELRLRTRRLLREAQAGEQIAVTFRGKPLALLVPFDEGGGLPVRPYKDAWVEIEATLRNTRAAYRTPERAIKATRRRA